MLLASTQNIALAQGSVWTQHNDLHRDGVNASETILTPSNVNQNSFGMLFKDPVDDQVYTQPLVFGNLAIAGGTHNVAYVATTNNSVYAFDADTGVQYWHVNLGPAATVGNLGLGCTDMVGTVGIIGTPVIDVANKWLYVVNQTFDGTNYVHHLHKLSVTTGADASGSPVTISNPAFVSKMQLQRTGLLLSQGNVYFAFSSHCDQGSWKGFVFGFSASTLAQTGEFNDSPSANGGAIWQSGNGPAADVNGNVYVVSGNGSWNGSTDFSETMFKLGATGLGIVDWHTPSNYSTLDGCDCDLTTSGAVLLPNSELIGGGKYGQLIVANMNNMGHLGDAGSVQTWQATSSHIHSLNFFNNKLYMWGQSDYLQVFSFNGTTFNTTPTFKGTQKAIGHPGASLSISANGTSNGILWGATNTADDGSGGGAWHATVAGIMYAFNTSGMGQIYNTNQNANRDDCGDYAKFAPPTIINGKVYLSSFGSHATGSGALCVYGELSGTSNIIPNGTYEFKNVNSGLALESPGWDHTQGLDMDQWTVNGGGNQLWSVINLGNNVITLSNNYSSQQLEVAGNVTTSGALVDQWPYNGQTNQQWKVTSLGGGQYELTAVNSGLALEVVGAGTGTGVKIDQWPYNGGNNQRWTITLTHP
ncbi:MAG TPA: RICIN domain-containing protein [Acidobacteriaceae bacterium]|nr:RICIN domain-containing protein [Acidobacteriaceae bacterium]